MDLKCLRPEDLGDFEHFEPKKDLEDFELFGDFGGEIRNRLASGDKFSGSRL